MNNFVIFLLIFTFIILVILFQKFKSERITNNTIVCFTGGLGAGKTYMAVNCAIHEYRRQASKYKLFQRFPFLRFFDKSIVNKPCLYSNIPIRISKYQLSMPLLLEHITMKEKLPEKAIVVFDEIGSVCSQYDYDNPIVQIQISTFIRFFRHFTDGKLYCTDQSSDNIVVGIRRRINLIYNLDTFRRFGFVLPFYKVNVNPVMCIEESQSLINDPDQDRKYFFGYLPYRLFSKKLYQSRCYKPLYYDKAVKTVDRFTGDLYTRYLIDIECSAADKKKFKTDREFFKNDLFE